MNLKKMKIGIKIYILFLALITLILYILFGVLVQDSYGFIKSENNNHEIIENHVITTTIPKENHVITTTQTTTTEKIETTKIKTTKKITTSKKISSTKPTNNENVNNTKLNFSDNSIVNNYDNNLIVSSAENNQEKIYEIFSKGMDASDFYSLINKTRELISSNDNYSFIEYDFEKKLSYNEVENYLYRLNNSSIVKLEKIGVSLDNRSIYGLEIGTGTKKFIIDANIHASESGTTIILLKYLIDIVNKYEQGESEIIDLLSNVMLVVIPCINPDGYEVYNFGIERINNKNLWIYKNKDAIDFNSFKFNANGVDINRNMPSQNGGLYYKDKTLLRSVSKTLTTKKGIFYSGVKLGAEPETKALMYVLLKNYKDALFYINMHSQGRVIYYGKPNLSSNFNDLSSNFADKIKMYNSYVPLGIGYEQVGQGNDGTATDFMAELVNGFKFSVLTGRLTNETNYLNADVKLQYNCAIVTLETLNTITKDVSYYKDEYYNKNFYYMFNNLMKDYI